MSLAVRPLGLYILDDDGAPQREPDTITWALWMQGTRDRVLAHTLIKRRERGRVVRVSTVFLGVDYRHLGDGPPILWETLIVGGPFHHWMQRYPSELEAWRGHARAVALVEAFATAPRKTKKALRKFGARYCTRVGFTMQEWRRVARVLTRAGWDTDQ